MDERIQNYIKTELIPEMVKKNAFSDESKNLKVKSIELSKLGTDGTFMLTVCHRVHLVLEDENGKEISKSLIVKLTPEAEPTQYEGAQFDKLFENEINAYTVILPMYGDSLEHIKCYYSYNKEQQACIVLEDFDPYGWEMSKARYNLSLEHILVTVKELARFHANGYILKLTNKNKFQEIITKLKESRFGSDELHPVWEMFMKCGPIRAIKSVKETPETATKIPSEFLDNLGKLLDEPHKQGKLMVRPREPLATIAHGDFLRNNIAFKYDPNTKLPIKCMMFDYQTLRYSSPMVDLCVFISNSTGADVRLPNFDLIFDSYYNELVKTIKQRTDVPDYINRVDFLKEYTLFTTYGLGIMSSFFPCIVAPEEYDTTDMMKIEFTEAEIAEALNMFNTCGGEIVNREMRGLILEMYELQKKLNVDIFNVK